MAKNKKTDYAQYPTDELQELLRDEKLRQERLNFNHAAGLLEDPRSIRNIRKDIARINTELRRREINEKNI